MSLVTVENLSVEYGKAHPTRAVRNVSLQIEENEFVGLVGESGCGKSTLGFAIARLERPPARIVEGRVIINDLVWTDMHTEDLLPHRWQDVAIVLQSGMNALNPVMSIEFQFRDVMIQHTRMSSKEILARSYEVLDMVGVPRDALRRYPHELSGGMKQRVAIAMAMLLKPQLIIMDEPTTALDMVVQRQILENLKLLRQQQAFSVLFISHDLGVVLELADRVIVMYAGQIVESQESMNLLHQPMHPYTRALLRSLPDAGATAKTFSGIPGTPPDLGKPVIGCAFAPRCDLAQSACTSSEPELLKIGTSQVRCIMTGQEVDRDRINLAGNGANQSV